VTRNRKDSEPMADEKVTAKTKPAAEAGEKCCVEKCKQPVRAKGYCRKHYMNWRRARLARSIATTPAARKAAAIRRRWWGVRRAQEGRHRRRRSRSLETARARSAEGGFRIRPCPFPSLRSHLLPLFSAAYDKSSSKGGKRLHGDVCVSGAKNAALPISPRRCWPAGSRPIRNVPVSVTS